MNKNSKKRITSNKNILLLFDGPSGAGKTTIINRIINGGGRWKNFELMPLVTTRKRRPSDGLETETIDDVSFDTQVEAGKIILSQTYARNKKRYAIKKSSLVKIKTKNVVGNIYLDWKIIDKLRKHYRIIAIFLSAKEIFLKNRLLERADSEKQKMECINYNSEKIKNYQKNKHYFDYYLENNTTIEDLENKIKKILKLHKAIKN